MAKRMLTLNKRQKTNKLATLGCNLDLLLHDKFFLKVKKKIDDVYIYIYILQVISQ